MKVCLPASCAELKKPGRLLKRSGIGGLTAAALLSVHGGKRVLVLERHYVAGGFTHSFHRPGFDWDVGLHYIGQVQAERSPVRRAFDHLTGDAVKWAPMPDVYDRVRVGDRTFDFVSGVERFRGQMKSYFPGEARAIDRYIHAVQSANRMSGLYDAEKAIPAPAAAVLGGLMRAPFMRWARQSTLDVLTGITANRELIGVLTAQWGDYGLPPAASSFAIHATIAGHYFAGASYPVGGASTIAAAILPLIQRNGGLVVTGAEVDAILIEANQAAGVRMADGRELRSPQVLSDAGAANTFNRLLPQELPAVESLRAELRKLPTSPAHLSLYVGLNATDQALGLNGTNLWIYPGLDHDENLRRFAADPGRALSGRLHLIPIRKVSWTSRAAIPVTAPSTSLPQSAMTPSRLMGSRWRNRGAEYEALKQTFAGRLQQEMLRQVPQVAGDIARAELSTPVTTQHFMNYRQGEIYGIAATPALYLLRSLGARTPIPNLYLTGQDVSSLGVVGALYGGAISASVALGKNLMGALHKPLPSV